MDSNKTLDELKQKGNDFFGSKEYESAKDAYSEAISLIKEDEIETDQNLKDFASKLYCNRAMCFLNMKQYELCVSDCNKALEFNDKYLKAKIRKFLALKELNKFSEAMQEINSAISLDESIEKEYKNDIEICKRGSEQEMNKMFSDLKDVGNQFLGLFGLSTDNFKLQKDENGGYKVNFQSNK